MKNIESNLLTKNWMFRDLESKYEMVEALRKGTDAMRKAGTKYLPKSENERTVDYNNRLSSSTLFPYYKDALLNATYAITSREMIVENAPESFQDVMFNVDLEGRSLEEFSYDVIQDSIHYGCSYILIDYFDGPIKRPYFVNLKPTQLLTLESSRKFGAEILTKFRFMETINDESNINTGQGFTDQIREYSLNLDTMVVSFIIYNRDKEGEWFISEQGVMEGQDRIPIVPVYSNRIGFYLAEPTFINLAELNVRHFQSYSDQSNLLHYARFPILFAKGIDSHNLDGVKTEIEIGANTVTFTSNENASLEFVEHGMNAVQSGFDDLDLLTEHMDKYNHSISVASGSLTDTQSNIMASRLRNQFNSISNRYELAMQQAFAYASQYLQLSVVPTFTVRERSIIEDNENNG